MPKGNEDLSHAEIWDDSALIDSWNSALDEYKKYHSIQANGGTLEDLEAAVQSSYEKNSEIKAKLEQAEQEPPVKATPHVPEPAPHVAVAAPAPPPQALLGSMQDEGLKKLLMSWYYAGYYTGLYEGQQHAQKKTDNS